MRSRGIVGQERVVSNDSFTVLPEPIYSVH